MTYRKKLIEVALPLEAINVASAREKSIRHGHPSTLHLWWARRPLAACRAVLFSSLVDDPSEYMSNDPSTDAQEAIYAERERLFRIIEDLVLWENSNNEEVLDAAKLEIARSVARNLGVDVPIGKEAIREFLATKAPPVLDPFAGGGSIPLEAQRLGLRAYASDLNPVAVLINKALIEIPPKFANMPPVHPPESALSAVEGQGNSVKKGRKKKPAPQDELWQKEWKGAQGLAEDVRYYGKWMRDEAFKHIGHLYPPVMITKEILAERPDLKEQGLKAGDQLTVIAWLWARTVKCPNPACGVEMPLVRSFVVSKKSGAFWANPTFKNGKLFFDIKTGKVSIRDGTVNRHGAFCISCGTTVPLEYVRAEGQASRIDSRMMAVVAEGSKGRVVLPPIETHEMEVLDVNPVWKPNEELQGKCRVSVPLYGMNTFGDLFTPRQLILLTKFSELVSNASELIWQHLTDQLSGNRRKEYLDAITTYLGMAVSKTSVFHNVIARWRSGENKSAPAFGRQAIPMVWDYAEVNPFAGAGGDFTGVVEGAAKVIETLPTRSFGESRQADATQLIQSNVNVTISTDPPYYDNIEYADLSDFFYIWLRPILSKTYPNLFGTLLTPKSQELVASPFRFVDSGHAQKFFEDGLEAVFNNFRKIQNPENVLTVYYAFKQSETDEESEDETSPASIASTGWETLLEGMLRSGFCITGTWPSRTEGETRLIARSSNALASSIVLVCRPRLENATSCSRREFLSALKKELAPALRELQQGSIAPVDLAQAAIGPGMAVYSRYSAVLEADGKPMSVRTALGLINQALDEYLSEQEGEYDTDTRWALSWYEQFGHNEAAYGVAETLSKAKNTAIEGLVQGGILEARAGKVRLLKRDELDTDWDPSQDKRLTAWEACQHLIYALENSGEESAAAMLSKLGEVTQPARDLAYRLYTVCERKGWAQDALGYNSLVVAWPRLKELSARKVEAGQGKLL